MSKMATAVEQSMGRAGAIDELLINDQIIIDRLQEIERRLP